MKFLKIFLYILAGIVALLLVFVATAVTTIDYTPYRQMDYYRQWKEAIASAPSPASVKSIDGKFQAGWAKVNYTPDQPVPMAGYGNRRGRSYETVHDSVYARALYLSAFGTHAVIVSLDLLIVPPTVTEALKKRLPEVGLTFGQVYLGATHSHNSIGGWGDTITGELFAGKYDPAVVDRIVDAIIQSIAAAKATRQVAEVGYFQVKDTADIYNRLVKAKTPVDPWVRNLYLKRSDGKTALVTSYAAHATVLNSNNFALSRDYAGALVDSLEDGEADFALYLAGAVASMGPEEVGDTDFAEVGHQADGVETAIQSGFDEIPTTTFPTIHTFTVPLPLRQPSPRLDPTWVLRPWLFRWAFGDYPSFVKVLRVGNVLLVGLPCDFSGELTAPLSRYAAQRGLKLMVTSFDGAYAGYITADEHFHKKEYETITMNWFGPYNGAYFSEVIRDVIDKVVEY